MKAPNRARAALSIAFLVVLGTSACLLGGKGERSAVRIPADLSEWDGDPRFWSVQDGVLVGESTPENPCEATSYLVWRGGEVDDFELTFEYRIEGGNSGVQFRSREVAPWQVAGYQADFDAAGQWTGCLYEQDGRGVVATRGQHVTFDAAGQRLGARLEGSEAAEELPLIEPPGWNSYRVRALGDTLTLEVNGVLTTQVVDRAPQAARAGLLALQIHQGGPMRVEFRNLVLWPLAGQSGQLGLAELAPLAPGSARRWIWTNGDEIDGDRAWMRRSFDWNGSVKSASLWATCDNVMQLFLNGDRIVESDDWQKPVRVDLTENIVQGTNLLSVEVSNEGGPAGFVLELELEDDAGERRSIVSDGKWLVTADDPGPDWTLLERDPDTGVGSSWSAAVDLGAYGSSPWGTLGEGSEPERTEALAADEIELPDGFEVELLYSVPRIEQGSWVSLCADDRGRLFASDQYGGLFRITLNGATGTSGGNRSKVTVEPVPVELGEAHGLLWAFDALYVVVSKGGEFDSGLYRVTDQNGDDQLDTVESLIGFKGSGEHGPHAVIAGPGGKSLYLVAGNHVDLIDVDRSRVPTVWDEDQLLPRLDDPNGHAVGKLAPGGWIVRTDPDGRSWELVAIGLRNSYDIAFDPNGELFTFDADMEWDTGLPWYRPTRILHVVSGAEFGWRHGSGKWPTHYADSLPSAVDLGLTSPTGIAFGTDAAFPDKWRRALYAADWAYGQIFAVHLAPDGATYTGTSELFATGKPLPVTDLAVAPDGALYFTTGGRRAQSGLYRVTWAGADTVQPTALEASAPTPESEQRRSFEAFHSERDRAAPLAVWPGLSSADRFVRFAARTALEQQDPAWWRSMALAERDPRASAEALIALVRTDETIEPGALRSVLSTWRWAELELDTLLLALRAFGLATIRVPELARDGGCDEVIARLFSLWPTGTEEVDHEIVRLLSSLQAEGLAGPALDLLESAPTQEAAIDYARSLSTLRKGWNDARRARLLAWFDQTSLDYEGGNSFRKYIDHMRENAIDALGVSFTVEAATPRRDDVYAPLPDRAPLAFVKDYSADDLESELGRLSSEERDLENGKALFRQTSCLQCHRIAGDGGGSGPDLTGVASRFSPRDFLATLLEPSETISDQYRDTEVWTVDGNVTVGRILKEDARSVLVRDANDARIEISTDQIELKREHPLSRMPDGLIDVLTVEEVLDLLAYVLSGG